MRVESIPVAKPLAVGQVAHVCNVTTRTINNWIRAGLLKAYATPGGHFRIWPSDLRKFLKAHSMDINFEFGGERPKRILVVDDDENYAEMIKELFRDKLEKCEIDVTHDGYEALILVGEKKPDLMILDLMMPGIDGFKVLDLIAGRRIDHPMHVLVLSGNLSPAAVERLKRSRADHWLSKPVSSAELLNAALSLLSDEELGGIGLT